MTHTHTRKHRLRCLSAVCATHPSLFSASLRKHHNGAASKKRKQEEKTASSSTLSPSLYCLQQSQFINPKGKERREEKKAKEKKKKGEKKGVRGCGEQKGKSKQFWVSSHFSLRTEGWKKKKINYGAHLNIISSTQPPTLCPSPRKPNYSANLSLAVAGLVLKKTIKQAWINLWQAPYL